MNNIKAIITAVSLTVATVTTAQAEGDCRPKGQMYEFLTATFNEERQIIGATNEGNLMEIFVNRYTGTWTFLFTEPDGESCLILFGDEFMQALPASVQKGTKS